MKLFTGIFSPSLEKKIKLERPLTKKLKFKHFFEFYQYVVFFCENESYTIATIMTRTTYFAKFTLTRCFNPAFTLLNLTRMK